MEIILKSDIALVSARIMLDGKVRNHRFVGGGTLKPAKLWFFSPE